MEVRGEPFSQRALAFLMAIALLVAIAPLYATQFYPSNDFMLHLARCAILDRSSSPFLNEIYTIKLQPIPNLAIDVIVPALAKFMSVAEAGRTFMVLTFVLQVCGTLGIMWSRKRRLDVLMLTVPILCWNFIVMWGFSSYLFGVGLGLCTFAVYMLVRDRSLPLRLVLLLIGLTLTYFAHLAAFGMLMLALFMFEARALANSEGRKEAWARFGVILLAALPSAYVHLKLSPISSSTGTQWFDKKRLIEFGYMFNLYGELLDVIVSAVIVVALILLWRSKAVKVHPAMKWVVVAALAAYFLVPYRIFGSHFTNTRLLVFFWFVFVAAWTLAEVGPIVKRRIALGALAILGFQCGIQFVRFVNFGSLNQDMDRVAQLVPEHSMLLTLEKREPEGGALHLPMPAQEWRFKPPSAHVFTQLLLAKDVFVPQLYLLPGKQPVEVKDRYFDIYLAANTMSGFPSAVREPEFEAMSKDERAAVLKEFRFDQTFVDPSDRPKMNALIPEIVRQYSALQESERQCFLIYRHRGDPANPLPSILREVWRAKYFTLYEVEGEGR